MKYRITRRILGYRNFVEITMDTFEATKKAKSNLMNYLFIEEKLEYVLGNLYEFEMELTKAGLDDIFISYRSWSDGVSQIHSVVRRIINLLAACRLYLDHVMHNIGEIYGGKSDLASLVKAKKKEQYDNVLAYRAMEALRNYAQHRGIPLNGITWGASLVGEEQGNPVQHIVRPWLRIGELAEDSAIKPSIIAELKAVGEKVDIRPLIREYVDCIGRIHGVIRAGLDADSVRWKTALDNIVEQFKATGDVDLIGLVVAEMDDSGKLCEAVDVFFDFIERREELAKKNRRLADFARHFISTDSSKE